MTPEMREEIKAKIAKEQAIIVPNNDAIFAIMIANEVMFDFFISKMEKSLNNNSTSIEDRMEKYLADAKELAEIKINAAADYTFNILETQLARSLEEIDKSASTVLNTIHIANNQNKINYLLVALIAAAAVIIGFFLGKLF